MIAFARKQVGKPYVSGASGPSAFDCSGLTKMAVRQIGLNWYHGATTQWSRGFASGSPAMYGYWARSGPIATLPMTEVAFLFNQDKSRTDKLVMAHTGIYDGRGRVIQAGGQYKGVSDKPLNKSRWSHWATSKPEWMVKDMSETVSVLLKVGDKGTKVKALQGLLVKLGYALLKHGADGDFGGETQAAIKAFQAASKLPTTGYWTQTDEDKARLIESGINEPPDRKAVLLELQAELQKAQALVSRLLEGVVS